MGTTAALEPGFRLFPVRPLWTLAINSSLVAPPAFAGTRAYFPIEGDRLAAYDLVAGTLQWIASVRTGARPAAGDGLIFIVEPETLTALRDTDGSVAWRLPFVERLGAPIVWHAGWLLAASASGTVFAFRAADGALMWRRDTSAGVHAAPAFGGDHVYVPLDDTRLLSLRADDGAIEWERRLGGPANDVLALDDRVYLGSDDNFFYCLMTSDGRIAWRWRTGADVVGTPVVDDQRVYFVSLDNVLRGLDRITGAQRWKRPLTIRPTEGLTRAGDALLVSGRSARVSGFYMRDGAPAGEITAPGELAGPPHVAPPGTTGLPMVTVVGRDIAKGAVVAALIREIEPATAPVSPLPNPAPVVPTLLPPSPAAR